LNSRVNAITVSLLVLPVVGPARLRGSDILLLAPFGPASQQNDDLLAILAEVDSIAGPEIDSIFEHARSHAFHVRQIALSQALQSHRYLCGSLRIEPIEPTCEWTAPVRVEVLSDVHQIVSYMLPFKATKNRAPHAMISGVI
jgi:hypothetical protein